MHNVLADQTAAQALLFAVIFVIVALRPRGGTRRKDIRGEIPAHVGMGTRNGRGAPGGTPRLQSVAQRFAVKRLATPVWMTAALTLLCGVGAASALMADASSYSTTINGDSPSIYYRLNEGSGTSAADSSGNGHTGTYQSGVTYGVGGAIAGDDAITAPGTSAAVRLVSPPIPSGNSARTYEFWLKTASSTTQVLIGSGDAGTSLAAFSLVLDNATTLRLYTVTNNPVFTLPIPLNDSVWHDIALTYDGTNVVLYFDGQEVGSQALGATLVTDSTKDLAIGSNNDTGSFPVTGSLDDVAIYPSALSASRIAAHWQAAAGTVCPSTPTSTYGAAVHGDGPLRYIRLDDVPGVRTAQDYSGNCASGAYEASTVHATGAIVGDTDTAASASGAGTGATAWLSGIGMPSGNASRTVELWFQTASSSQQLLVAMGTIGGSQAFGMILDTPTSLRVYTGGPDVSYPLPYPINDNRWHYAAVTYDGTNETLFLDGQTMATAVLSTLNTAVPGSGVIIGANLGAGLAFAGNLDEFAMYASSLTSAQIVTHWMKGEGRSCPAVPTAGYGGAVVADHPTRFLPLDDAPGAIAIDYSSSTACASGAYAGTAVRSSGPLITGTAPAMQRNGTAGGAATTLVTSTGTGLPSGNSARTIEVWMNTGSSATQVIFGTGVQGGNQTFGLVMDNPTTLRLYTGSNTSWTTPKLADSTWHHIAVTYDGTNAVLYVDGVAGTSQTVPTLNTPVPGTAGLVIGANNDTGFDYGFNGGLADVAVYGTALSATRVLAHFDAGASVGGAVTAAQYKSAGNKEMICTCAHGDTGKYPIDNATGNFYHQFTDVSIPGRSTPLASSRNYNSLDAATDGPLGYGWTTNYGTTALAVSGSTATLTDESGSQATFTQSGGVWAPSSPRFIATLVENGGGTSWTLTRFNRDTLTFNSTGQLTADADLNGYATSYTYTSGKLTTVSDEAGRTLTLAYTGSHVTSVTDANVSPTRVVSYTYDGSGNLTDVTDVLGGDQHFTYDGSHQMTVMKDPKCEALGGGCPGIQNTYTSGKITAQKDRLNRETDFDYTSIPGATKVTDPKGNVTVTYYNQGLRVAQTSGYGTGSAATTYFAYDPSSLALTTIVDPNGHTTTDTVDASGNVLTRTDPLGRVTTNTYNGFNEVLTTQDGNGVTTTNTYDGDGNLTRTCRPLPGGNCGGSPTSAQVTTYNRADATHPGDVTSVVDPDSKTTTTTFDSYGNVASSTDPLSNEATSTYSADGLLLTSVSPKGNVGGCSCASTYTTTNTYNKFGELLTSTDPLNHVATKTYDADGNLATSEDPNSNTITYTYDVANQLTTTTRPDSTTGVTDYNSDGTVLDQKDGKGNAILTYGYDSLARVTTSTDALSNVTTITYDAAGNRLTQQDPGGNCTTPSKCTTTAYNADNESTSVAYSDGVTPDITSLTYDGDGQRTGATDGTGTSAWVFDNLHRMTTSYTNGHGTAASYAYNLRSLPTTITYPGSHAVTNSYDNAGRMTAVADWLGSPNTTTFGYDQNGNLTSDTLQSGIVDTYTYNAANQRTAISDVNGGATIFAATYVRDSNGQLASDTSQAANQGSYKYTSLNQLCYAGSGTANACASAPSNSYPYGFDTADNLTTMENAAHSGTNAQQFNSADELCWTVGGTSANACGSAPAGATTFNYDDRGGRTSQVPSAGSATCTAFDQADRLTSVKAGTGSSCTSPATVGTYAYDGSGMRQSKTVSGTTTQFLSSGSALLDETAGSANPTYYIYGPGGRPIEQIDPSGAAHFYHADQVGSVRTVTNTGGTADATYTYDPYGNVVSSTNPGAITNHLQFQGQYFDSESGLLYLRARYYDPGTAQFLSRDPMVATTGSPYAYVGGNPLNAADPSGLWGISISCDTCGNFIHAAANVVADTENDVKKGAGTSTGHWVIGGGIVVAGVVTCVFWCPVVGIGVVAGAGGGGSVVANDAEQLTAEDAAASAAAGRFSICDDASHMFRNAAGHVADSPGNRQLLTDTANNSANYMSTNSTGVATYRQALSDGSQAWAEVYKGRITNGGINASPR